MKKTKKVTGLTGSCAATDPLICRVRRDPELQQCSASLISGV